MCQLIEVTWFIWLSADQLIILLDRDQCSVSYFLASLGSEHRKTDTRQCCDPLTAVKTRYPLTSITWPYRELKCPSKEVTCFFEVLRWQVTSFQLIAGSTPWGFAMVHVWFLKVNYKFALSPFALAFGLFISMHFMWLTLIIVVISLKGSMYLIQVVRYQAFGHYHAHFDSGLELNIPCCHQNPSLRPPQCRICR